MTTTNVPHPKEQNVAETPKKPAEQKAEPAPKPALASAAATGDPAVQKLLAELETHESNGDTNRADETRKELAALGYK